MAATPKPVRKEIKKAASFTKKHSPSMHKGVEKETIRSKAKVMKSKGMKKSDISTMKKMY